ncbi:hypothetical protein GALL_06360 [mine drainage metagenome]|uniref:Uncharacterized protein n=1 Tax=mine drainage metagenome TaxID=410659 RepID=A0A1J5TU02_9ZZZZ
MSEHRSAKAVMKNKSVPFFVKTIRLRYIVFPAMRDVQPDDLSPKAALEKIYQLKKLV